jgi:hypothetical protein
VKFTASNKVLCGSHGSRNGDDEHLDEKGHWPVPSGSADRLYVVHLKKHKNYVSSHPGVSIKDNPCKRCKTL